MTATAQIDTRVPRAEVREALTGLFGTGAVRREGVLAGARASGARREVIEVLEWLPALRYQTADQVMKNLPAHRVR